MKPRLSVLTLGVIDLGRSLAFWNPASDPGAGEGLS